MNLRDQARALRVYLKSYALFRSVFRDPARALWLPLSNEQTFHGHDGKPVAIPGACWTMLPTVCRLLQNGASPGWEEGALKVAIGAHVLYAPPLDKSIGWTLKEIFIDDEYGIFGRDLSGMTVLDVGAYIGDSTLAFCSRGAFVHAFEPVPLIRDYLRRNVGANGLGERVRVHEVGLSDTEARVTVQVNVTGLAGATTMAVNADLRASGSFVSQELRLVNALEYLGAAGIRSADMIKLDCEGCEYAILGDGSMLESLRPSEIMMEYHRGGAALHEVLLHHGYRVHWPDRGAPQGYMHAVRNRQSPAGRMRE